MLQLSWLLAALAVCLALAHTVQRLAYKVLRYRAVRPTQTVSNIISLLSASSYQLETEVEARCQLGRDRSSTVSRSISSLQDFIDEEVRKRTELDSLIEALSDSPFFKTLDSKPLTAIAEALQTEGRQQGCGRFVHCDCFYQSDTGLDRLFVLSDSDTQVTLSLQPASGGGAATRFRTGGLRLLYSPSGLARSLLSERQRQSISQAVHSFPCSLHARMPPDGFWSISFASIANCLDAWPEAKRHLLLQLWSHINDTLLLVLVEWLGLEAGRFLETKFYEDLLSQEIDRLADEVAATSGANFASMSFYERRPLYRRLAVRLLEEISGTASPSEGAEDHITIVYCSVAPDKEALDGFRAFLVLEGRLETTPTQATLGVSQGSSSVLPGWVGLVPYFAQSRLPFQVRPAVDDADDEDDAKRDGSGVVGGGGGGGGVVLAIFSDALMDEMFRYPKATESSSEAAVSFLLRQLTRQVFLYDMLINNRRLHRGDHLVRKGDPTETVEIVVSGRLRRDGSTEFTRGDCPGLIEGLMESGAVSTCWSGDIVAVRESRAVSLPLSLARAWVSNTRRLNILDRLLGSMCEAQLDRQQQRLTRLQRRKQTRLRACRRDASDNGIKENNDDDLGYAPDEDEKPVAHVTAWLTRQRRRNRSRLVGFEIDPTRFNLNELLHHLQLCLDAAHGTATAMVVSETDVERHFGRPADQLPDAALRNWLEDLELAFSVLVLVSTGPVTRWTRMVLGFLDCLVVCCDSNVAGADASGEVPSKAENFYSQMHLSRVHVAVFHPLTLRPVPEGTSLRFLRRRRWWARRVYHVRYSTGRYKPKPEGSAAKPAAQSAAQQPELASWISSHSDLARLTRCVTGAGVGLAFGSAAPRGLANFGVLEALLADGVAVDMIAGSGLGALTAAAWALHAGDIGATRAGLQRHWARIDSRWSRLRDLTLPLVATYTGAELNASLRQLFGDHRQAEDLWLPFVAVSTDLVAAQAVAHATGTLWRSVRASCGLVGAYPPVWEPRTGRLLLDGAHTDRMPARTLRRRLKARYVVAAALESKRRLRPGTYLVFGDAVSGFSELLRSLNPFRLTPLAPAAADIQGALGSLASGELSVGGKDDDDDLEDEEDAGDAEVAEEASVAPLSWCVTVQPDPSFSTEEFAKAGGRAGDFERWRGYWAARRRLRRLGTVGRTALQGRAWATQTSGQIG